VTGVCLPDVLLTERGLPYAGAPRTLDASGSSISGCTDLEYQWLDELGTVIHPWDPAASTIEQSPLASTRYTVEVRCVDVSQCPVIGSEVIDVTVEPLPPVEAGVDRTVCLTEATVLGATGDPSIYDYSWDPASELDDPSLAEPTFRTLITAPTGPRIYTLTVTDRTTGCMSTATVTVNVVDAAPVGTIGNHLYAVRAAGDVELDWRSSPLNPRSYNLHREWSKLLIDPPASSPLSAVSLDEFFRDIGAVQMTGTFFYETYGRDCAGGSIFE